MKIAEAEKIAQKYLELFKPHCERIEIAGSIRRGKAEVNDIEIVCIPKTHKVVYNMFDEIDERDNEFVKLVHRIPRVKGDGLGKYIQFLLPENIKLDMFTATPRNWGYILAIRTGSAYFSHNTLAKGWRRAGYKGNGGMLEDEYGNEVEVKEEIDLFHLIGLPFVKPEARL